MNMNFKHLILGMALATSMFADNGKDIDIKSIHLQYLVNPDSYYDSDSDSDSDTDTGYNEFISKIEKYLSEKDYGVQYFDNLSLDETIQYLNSNKKVDMLASEYDNRDDYKKAFPNILPFDFPEDGDVSRVKILPNNFVIKYATNENKPPFVVSDFNE